jgi:hypothetical protein
MVARVSRQAFFIKFDGEITNANRRVDGLLSTALPAHATADGTAFYGALQPLERSAPDAGDPFDFTRIGERGLDVRIATQSS